MKAVPVRKGVLYLLLWGEYVTCHVPIFGALSSLGGRHVKISSDKG